MATTEPLLSIGQVAQRVGLRTSHIRFYERVGVLPARERVSGQRRYREDVLHRLSIIDVAQRAGLTLEEIRLAGEKLPHIEALIARAQAVKHWLQVAQSCDCASVDICGLFVDPTLTPPADDIGLDIRQVRPRAASSHLI